MGKTEEVYYREVQRFRQKVMWLIIIAVDVLLVAFFSYQWYQRIVLNQVTSEPLTLMEAWILWILFGMAIPLLVTSLFLTKLVVEVRENEFFLRFFPFAKRNIPYSEIVSYEVSEFHPILDYGGVGVRYMFGGWAYLVSGKRGVMMKLKNGKRLLIGSQDPEKLVEQIAEAMGR